MKQKRRFLLLGMLLMMACCGCKEHVPEEKTQTIPDVTAQTEVLQTAALEIKNPESVEKLLEIAAISGSVVEFSDEECKITPTQYEENMAYEAAPGYETELVTIRYCEGCTFQFANVNVQIGSVTYEPAGVEDIGKQVSLVVCGKYDSDGVLRGERVFIYRTVG